MVQACSWKRLRYQPHHSIGAVPITMDNMNNGRTQVVMASFALAQSRSDSGEDSTLVLRRAA